MHIDMIKVWLYIYKHELPCALKIDITTISLITIYNHKMALTVRVTHLGVTNFADKGINKSQSISNPLPSKVKITLPELKSQCKNPAP